MAQKPVGTWLACEGVRSSAELTRINIIKGMAHTASPIVMQTRFIRKLTEGVFKRAGSLTGDYFRFVNPVYFIAGQSILESGFHLGLRHQA